MGSLLLIIELKKKIIIVIIINIPLCHFQAPLDHLRAPKGLCKYRLEIDELYIFRSLAWNEFLKLIGGGGVGLLKFGFGRDMPPRNLKVDPCK